MPEENCSVFGVLIAIDIDSSMLRGEDKSSK